MNIRAKFLGAAGTVTGSKYLLEIGGFNLLVDCGLFQGIKQNRLRNWDDFPVAPGSINAVAITHAHLDHTGYLPRLVKEGFEGPVYCTTATADLMKIILLDAAKLQEEEAAFARKKGYSRHENPEPLFTTEHAQRALKLVRPIDFKHWLSLAPNISLYYQGSGHILGAASMVLKIKGENQTKKITFSGDIGRYEDPILYDPEPLENTDILFMESTYGDRKNPATDIEQQLETIVNTTIDANGVLLIPAFAVGRTQLIMYYLHNLIKNKRIPEVNIFIDSPMAISVTDLYRRYHEMHKLKDDDLSNADHPVFDFKNIKYCRTQEESYNINLVNNRAIIISASGMSTGGRILHHMYHRLPVKNNTYMLVGYQAVGTRGKRIQDGEPTIKIFGMEVNINCNIQTLEGLSAHGDQTELMKWLSSATEGPKQTFIVHGEERSAQALASKIKKDLGWNCYVPSYLESFSLFEGI